ncbi:unnamed protein product, partial [Cladocopium goreaui]
MSAGKTSLVSIDAGQRHPASPSAPGEDILGPPAAWQNGDVRQAFRFKHGSRWGMLGPRCGENFNQDRTLQRCLPTKDLSAKGAAPRPRARVVRVVRAATALALGGVVLVLGTELTGLNLAFRFHMATFAAAEQAIESNLGHAAPDTTVPLSAQVGWNFPVIPEGAETTIIPVAFPVDSLPKEKQARLVQEMEIFAVLGLALMIWMLPFFFINRGLC